VKGLFAALAVGALALIAGATAATSAPASSLQHYMIGFGHTPTAADRAEVTGHNGTVRFSFPSIGVLAVDLAPDQVNDVKQATGATYVEADPVRTAQSLSDSQLVPSIDNGLYGLVTTHVVDTSSSGGAGVKACVADTGLDTRHPDIAPNLKNTYDVFSGKVGLHATDVFDLGVAATETHATHVSGIVAGADNGLGIVGVAPHASLYHARVLGTQPDGSVSGETSQVMAGVQWLAQQGCQVINMSLGGGDRSQAEEALYNQVRQNGTLIVVASGNDSANQLSYPARYQSVVAVGAVDRNDQLASFSNTGAQLDLVAPGVDNLSSFPKDQGRDASALIGTTSYSAFPLEFAPATSSRGAGGTLVNCGLATAPTDCGGASKGFIALIQRGSVSFATKVHNARVAGAKAAIIYNNAANGPGNFNGTLGTTTDSGSAWIPAISLSQTDGEAIAATLVGSATTVFNVASYWNYDSGTSMATPHVTGVAALILGKNPSLTPDQVESILEETTTDLGIPNYDSTFGYGLVNAQAALAATP
jgi:subtilisin family serine protease